MRGRRRDCGRRWGRGPGRGLRRLVEPVLLLRLSQGPAHGYRILSGLGEFGLEDLEPSVIYRFLREMEAAGFVTSVWDEEQTQGPPRRIYRITEVGVAALDDWATELRSSQERTERFLRAYQEHTSKRTSTDIDAKSLVNDFRRTTAE
jgi:PadR family transcriptional regulator, regulatory protein PadR